MPRFYVNCELYDNLQLTLPLNVHKHIHSLRLRANQDIELFNGDGKSYAAVITSISKINTTAHLKTCNNDLVEVHEINITLAMSMINNDKMDLVIQKATELGVNKIIPIYTKNTQMIKPDKLKHKFTRWCSIAISSMEQCGLNKLPILSEMTSFENIISNYINHTKFIMSPKNMTHDITINTINKPQNIILLIGPEGGFTVEEIKYATQNNAIPITLGGLILRSETAAIVGLSVIKTKFTNWIK